MVTRAEAHQAWEIGAAAWPAFTLCPKTFVAHVLDLAPAEGPLRAEDLYLVCAAVSGCAVAQQEFCRAFLRPVIRQIGARVGCELDELEQQLRIRLLLRTSARPPGLVSYRGRGRLVQWLRVIVLRHARRHRVAMRPVVTPSVLADTHDFVAAGEAQRYQPIIARALTEALASLSRRERNMLRHHLVDGLSAETIGAIYHVHRSTVSRRLIRARETVARAVELRLQSELNVRARTLRSILGCVDGGLDLSVRRALAS